MQTLLLPQLSKLGLKAILSGILTTSLTGALAGAFYGLV
jgi:nucleoside permease NupC